MFVHSLMGSLKGSHHKALTLFLLSIMPILTRNEEEHENKIRRRSQKVLHQSE